MSGAPFGCGTTPLPRPWQTVSRWPGSRTPQDVSKLEVRRRIGAGYTELQPAGWPAETHLDAIRGRTLALAAAVGHKSALEVRRRSLTVMALKTDQLDLFEVASLAAVPPERIRSEMRGITLRSVRLAN